MKNNDNKFYKQGHKLLNDYTCLRKYISNELSNDVVSQIHILQIMMDWCKKKDDTHNWSLLQIELNKTITLIEYELNFNVTEDHQKRVKKDSRLNLANLLHTLTIILFTVKRKIKELQE